LALVNEAFRRLAEYVAGKPGRYAGASFESVNIGEAISESVRRDPAWMAMALQNSGAGDLLRSFRRAALMRWPWRRDKVEKRSAESGFTSEIIAAREAYISGRRGIAELTATAQSCVSLGEGGFSLADVNGTTLLDQRSLALIG
jgi:hypothetical protein